MGLKVTVIVETGRPRGGPLAGETAMNREVFHVEWEGKPERAWIAAHVEHRIAALGADLVAKIAAVHGDLRDTRPDVLEVSLRGRPLVDHAVSTRREGFGVPTSPPMQLEALFADMRRRMEVTLNTIGDAVRDAQRIRQEADDKPL